MQTDLQPFGAFYAYPGLRFHAPEPSFSGKGGKQNHKNHIYYEALEESIQTGVPMSTILERCRNEATRAKNKARLKLIIEAEKALGRRNGQKDTRRTLGFG